MPACDPQVFAGVAMTNLPGILVLGLAKAQLIQIFFFRLNLLITVLGLLHGLVLLPVVLSYLGERSGACAQGRPSRPAAPAVPAHQDPADPAAPPPPHRSLPSGPRPHISSAPCTEWGLLHPALSTPSPADPVLRSRPHQSYRSISQSTSQPPCAPLCPFFLERPVAVPSKACLLREKLFLLPLTYSGQRGASCSAHGPPDRGPLWLFPCRA